MSIIISNQTIKSYLLNSSLIFNIRNKINIIIFLFLELTTTMRKRHLKGKTKHFVVEELLESHAHSLISCCV